MSAIPGFPLGAAYLGDQRSRFVVWAPHARRVEVELVAPRAERIALEPAERGYFCGTLDGAAPGSRYFYRLDGEKRRPDPASRFQPEGVHGPSQIIDPCFPWQDQAWRGLPLADYLLYELHVGTFTPEGTFDAVAERLDELVRLGVTVVELMPVAQFPGNRNWGYDGVYCFAAQDSYGGPDGLRRLVDACHRRGLAVALDVVYNHLGPEGNYLADFGPYFTERYRTPWGAAINFDDQHCDEVRRYFIENALHWVTDFHVDALRLDAVHAIFDESARPFLRELGEAVHRQAERLSRRVAVVAESNKNDARHVEVPELGGCGLDALWNDDFHHCLHVLLTGERSGYYADFGGLEQMAKTLEEGFVYTGQYSGYRCRRHGVSSRHIPAQRFVVCAQNHDQVGNRALGERLSRLVSFESLKLAAGAVLLSANVPLLFMGEEYGEEAPFLYFVSHSDEALIEAVRRGRRQEFSSFQWRQEIPDPQAESTFQRCLLNRELLREPRHRALWEFYRELIRLRRTVPALGSLSKQQMEVTLFETARAVALRRWEGASQAAAIFCFGEAPAAWEMPLPAGRWRVVLDSAHERWLGPGATLDQNLVSHGRVSVASAPRQVLLLCLEEDA